jgi:predicted amidophosphoribosyltransferase
MAALLSEKLAPFAEKWNFDAIIPIPSHWKRRLTRSTNGAEILAESIGRTLRIPVMRRRLVACRLAEKQGTLAPKARRRNVRGVFEILPEQLLRCGGPWQLEGQNILLIDDVMTTGATLDEATSVLLRAGAAKVFVAVVARGVGDPLLM